MSNHIHLIARAKEGCKLSDILRDLKKHTAKRVVKAIETESESRREWLLKHLADAGSKNKKNKTYQLWRKKDNGWEKNWNKN